MKWNAFFLLLGLMPISAKAYSQNEIIDLSVKDVTFIEVLKEITRQTGYDFLYNYDVLSKKGSVSMDVRANSIEELLREIFPKNDLEYEIKDKVIVVRPAKSATLAQIKQRTVTGTVKDSKGEPLPGVTIIIKGSSVGTSTDAKGNFTLPIPEGKSQVLIFTFIGMNAKEVTVTNQTNLQVTLEEQETELEEVVVNAGYFQRNSESFTGSQVTVKAEELKRVGSLNILQALNAFDPSIRIEENNLYGSDPNRVPEITIRGENSFDLRNSASNDQSNPNAPLYLIDGVEVTATQVYDLDMNRIDEFTILKDATATALYGSRGANGVILITTVRPNAGKIRLTANANFNFSFPDLSEYRLMNSREKLTYEKLTGFWTSDKNDFTEQLKLDREYNERWEEMLRGVETDWISQPLQISANQRYSVHVEGGDDHFLYGINLRYNGDKGVMKGSGRDNYGIGVIFQYNISTKLILRNDISIDNVKGINSPYGSFATWSRQNPYDRIYDDEGEFVVRLSTLEYNPMINTTLPNFNHDTYTSWQDNFSVDWRIITALRLRGRLSYNKQLSKIEIYKSPRSAEFSFENDRKKKGSYYISNGKSERLDGNLTLSFYQNIGNSVLNVGIGSNLQTTNSSNDSYTGTGFVSDNVDFIGAATQFEESSKPRGSYDNSKLIGFFTNINWGYDNRYFVDFSFRTDGSSRFGRNSRFAPFWSVGFAWNVQNEHFTNWSARDALKFRASMGSTGSVNFSSSQAMTTYVYDFDNEYNGVYGVMLEGYGNPSLKWQNTRTFNAGVDWTFLNGRLQLNADFYTKITDNLLLPIDVALSTGFSSYTENLGKLQNIGFDGRLRINIMEDRRKDLLWSVTLSAFHNKNKIKKLSNKLDELNAQAQAYNTGATVYRQYEEGRSQSALMVVQSAGIDPATGNEVFIKQDGSRTFVYDHNDKVKVGDMHPKIEGTFNSNLTWKGFNLYLLFKYKYGGKIYNGTLATKVEGNWSNKGNRDKRALYSRWQQPGDEVNFRRIDERTNPYQTTRMVQKDNLFALQSLSVSYDLPKNLINKWFMERVKVTLNTSDLFRFASAKQERGTEYPFAHFFSAGVSITFK